MAVGIGADQEQKGALGERSGRHIRPLRGGGLDLRLWSGVLQPEFRASPLDVTGARCHGEREAETEADGGSIRQ